MQKMHAEKKSGKALWLTLKFKLVMGSTLLILISVIGLSLTFIKEQRFQIRSQLVKRGETVAKLMAYNARYGVQIGDKPILDKLMGGLQDDDDVVYCIIHDKQGKIITSYNENNADIEKLKSVAAVNETKQLGYTNKQNEEMLNISLPVVLASESGEDKKSGLSDLEEDFFGSESDDEPQASPSADASSAEQIGDQRVIGAIQIGITLNNMKRDIAAAIRKTVLYCALIFAGGFVVALWIGTLISAPIRKVVSLLNDISRGEGDLAQRIHIKSNDETGDLATGFNTFLDKFQEIKKISIFLNELADGGGDLTKRLGIGSPDEIGMLAQGFDRFIDKLHEIICQVAENTEKIVQASQSVSDTTIRLARDLNDVAQQSGEVAASSTKISKTIEKTNENVTNVNELMNTTERACANGVEVVHEARNGMAQIAESIRGSSEVVAKLNDSSQKIGETITTVTEIADQTKLIAINAAIEASRVGAQGKGFSVVAEEIRRLAARVTKATEEISNRVKTIQEDSANVVNAMRKGMDEANRGLELSNRSEQSLEHISKSASEAKTGMNRITVASNEQSSTIIIISKNINSISESARTSSEKVTHTSQSMQELNQEVQALRQLVRRFILDRNALKKTAA